tara:strand:- start:1409 stop:1558 length:150 start_codon:yes stop_codon:yes gene_type:complete
MDKAIEVEDSGMDDQDADEEKRTGEGVKEYLVEYVGSLSTYRGFGELFY